MVTFYPGNDTFDEQKFKNNEQTALIAAGMPFRVLLMGWGHGWAGIVPGRVWRRRRLHNHDCLSRYSA
eukprot:1456755-Rhodomonas_salina.2